MEDRDFSAYDPRKVLAQEIERRADAARKGIRETAKAVGTQISGRGLTKGELREIRWMFGIVPGIERARIFPRNFWWPYPNDRAMTPKGNIYFPHQDFREDFSLAGVPLVLRALFMHEATHLYQHYALGMWVWVKGPFDRNYNYELKKGMPLRSYGLEQMGQIVEEFYILRHGGKLSLRPYDVSQYADALPVRR
jgi:hypothetical protein